MTNKDRFYLTTTLPYVNSAPHLGFALEIVEADIIARYHKLLGKEVVFNTGTDEHGLKIYRAALADGKTPQAYVDEYAAKFERLKSALNLSFTNFIRTTDPHHIEAAQRFWERCAANGDIEKKNYKIKYCPGCEMEKTESELVDGCCPLHPNLEIETIDEENYFFKFSKYQKQLLQLFEKYPDFVVPKHRLNEIKKFVEAGLQDFSISRLKEKMPWGIPVPGDEAHVMYVWFDALINYISTLGWPEDTANFEDFWGTKEEPMAVQIAGKDNLRQQSAMWQAMLLSAGLPTSRQILIHGFITSGGQKMSKSLGNVIDPFQIVEEFGTDALRYWIAGEAEPFEDSDFTWERFKENYNGKLANGLGNLASRIIKMATANGVTLGPIPEEAEPFSSDEFLRKAMDDYNFKDALALIWDKISVCDGYIQKYEPFKLVKTNKEEGVKHIYGLLGQLYEISRLLEPFMPDTSEKIIRAIKDNEPIPPLFPRVS